MAVSATLGQLGPRYGIGTNVSVYLRSQWARGVLSGAPSGAAVAGPVAIDTNGNATFAGLNPDTEYIIYANVSGVDVYTAFFAGTGGTMGSARDVEVVSSVAAGGGGGVVDTELPAAAALADTAANPSAPAVGSFDHVWNGGTWDRLKMGPQSLGSVGTNGFPGVELLVQSSSGNLRALAGTDIAGDTGNGANSLQMHPLLFDGALFQRARTPVIFKDIPTAALTAGTGATIWTPAAGKKFRLMGFCLSLSVAGSIIFGDNVVGTVLFRTPALAAAGVIIVGADMMGNGKLSAAANNVLKADVTASGSIAGFVFGTEE